MWRGPKTISKSVQSPLSRCTRSRTGIQSPAYKQWFRLQTIKMEKGRERNRMLKTQSPKHNLSWCLCILSHLVIFSPHFMSWSLLCVLNVSLSVSKLSINFLYPAFIQTAWRFIQLNPLVCSLLHQRQRWTRRLGVSDFWQVFAVFFFLAHLTFGRWTWVETFKVTFQSRAWSMSWRTYVISWPNNSLFIKAMTNEDTLLLMFLGRANERNTKQMSCFHATQTVSITCLAKEKILEGGMTFYLALSALREVWGTSALRMCILHSFGLFALDLFFMWGCEVRILGFTVILRKLFPTQRTISLLLSWPTFQKVSSRNTTQVRR